MSSGKSVEVLPRGTTYSYSDGDMEFGWGTDGRMLIARTGFEATSEMEILDAAGHEPRRNVSRNGFVDMNPGMSADGTMVTWVSDRSGLRSTDANPAQADVYAAFLTRDAFEAFQGRSPELSTCATTAEGTSTIS